MLRVGLTGGMGSGKSTAARMFAAKGAHVISADEIGRALMQPGEAVHASIAAHFGAGVVNTDRTLDRAALARIAFADGRVEELNAIVHPAVIAWQAHWMEEIRARDAEAVAIVESALIFETRHGGEGGWRKRFDAIVCVRAPEELKIARFVERTREGRTLGTEEREAIEAEGRRRLARQTEQARTAGECGYILTNDGGADDLQRQVDGVWARLSAAAKAGSRASSTPRDTPASV